MWKRGATATAFAFKHRHQYNHHHRPLSSTMSAPIKNKKSNIIGGGGSSGGGSGMSAAVDNILLRSLKDHYLEASKMAPPPKLSPPSPFAVVKGSVDRKFGDNPVLRRFYNNDTETIDISVMRLANLAPEVDEDEEEINQLFLHVDITKKDREDVVHFLCALYPDAVGIHSVRFGPKLLITNNLEDHQSRCFHDLDQKLRDGFHMYIAERGINEDLFPFLQAWLYVKDHRNLMRWFKSIGSFITQTK